MERNYRIKSKMIHYVCRFLQNNQVIDVFLYSIRMLADISN